MVTSQLFFYIIYLMQRISHIYLGQTQIHNVHDAQALTITLPSMPPQRHMTLVAITHQGLHHVHDMSQIKRLFQGPFKRLVSLL